MRWTLLVVAVFLLCLPGRPWGQTTAPVVSSVSGTAVAGTSITINGSLLVNEDKSHYDSFFVSHPNASGFEGANPNADGWWDSGVQKGAYTSAVKLTGAKSAVINFVAEGNGVDAGDAIVFWPNTTSNVYLRTYVRLHRNSSSGWFGGQRKMIGYYSNNDTLIMAPDGTAWPATWSFFYGGSFHSANNPSGNLAPDRWYCVEWYTTSSSWTVWVDGVQVMTESSSGGSGQGNGYHFGLFDSDGPAGLSIDTYYDNMATGSTRLYPLSTVEIGNSSNYATATRRYQAPTFLSDGQVQVTCDLTGLGSGPYYLWVTNSQQQRSAAFPLGAASAPAAPTNVVIR